MILNFEKVCFVAQLVCCLAPTDGEILPAENLQNSSTEPLSATAKSVTMGTSLIGTANVAPNYATMLTATATEFGDSSSISSPLFVSSLSSSSSSYLSSSSSSSSSSYSYSSLLLSQDAEKSRQIDALLATLSVSAKDVSTSNRAVYSSSSTATNMATMLSDNVVSEDGLETSEKPPTNTSSSTMDGVASSTRHAGIFSTVDVTSYTPGTPYREVQSSIAFSRQSASVDAMNITTTVADTGISQETYRVSHDDAPMLLSNTVLRTATFSIAGSSGSAEDVATSSSDGTLSISLNANYSGRDSITSQRFSLSGLAGSIATAGYSSLGGIDKATTTSYSTQYASPVTSSSSVNPTKNNANSQVSWKEIVDDCRASRNESISAGQGIIELWNVELPFSKVQAMAAIGNDLWVVGTDQRLHVLRSATESNISKCSISGRTWSVVEGITNVKNVTSWLDHVFVYTNNISLFSKLLPFTNDAMWELRTPFHPVNLGNWSSDTGQNYYGVPFGKEKISYVDGKGPVECGDQLANDYQSITASDNGVWIAKKDGSLKVNARGCTSSWTTMQGYMHIKTVSAAADELLLLTTNGTCYIINGITPKAQSGTGLLLASRTLSYATMSPSNVIWGVDANGALFTSQLP